MNKDYIPIIAFSCLIIGLVLGTLMQKHLGKFGTSDLIERKVLIYDTYTGDLTYNPEVVKKEKE